MPPIASLPRRPAPRLRRPRPRRAVASGALLGATVGAIAGLLAGGVVESLLLAAAGALLVAAVAAAAPDRPSRPPHPASEPTATLAVPPPGPDAPPGWYPDPDPGDGDEGVRRLWDGEAWTEHRWAPRA